MTALIIDLTWYRQLRAERLADMTAEIVSGAGDDEDARLEFVAWYARAGWLMPGELEALTEAVML